jgi:hypothetical protein
VHSWLAQKRRDFFSRGIRALVKRWGRCVERGGATLKIVIVLYLFLL